LKKSAKSTASISEPQCSQVLSEFMVVLSLIFNLPPQCGQRKTATTPPSFDLLEQSVQVYGYVSFLHYDLAVSFSELPRFVVHSQVFVDSGGVLRSAAFFEILSEGDSCVGSKFLEHPESFS
jgi:hypothetical protein